LLKKISLGPAEDLSRASSEIDRGRRLPDTTGSEIDFALADLLFKDGKKKEAKAYVDSAIVKAESDAAASLYLLSAACNEASGNFAAAAGDYYRVTKARTNGLYNGMQGAFETDCLRKAVALYEKQPGAASIERVAVLTRLADLNAYEHRDEAQLTRAGGEQGLQVPGIDDGDRPDAGEVRRPAGRDGHAGGDQQLPADQQSVQRVQPDAGAGDRDGVE